MYAYSPFEKELYDLQSEDLVNLKQVLEGWYIEYKREMPNALSIAKSLSAFANTYGGWLFFGIKEESKENPVAGEFPGIARYEVDAALQCIRKSAADSVNPSPYYDLKVLWGAVPAIGLAEDKAIICIQIPRSSSAPHVHKNGVIYRRVSDASEPKPENDRFILDQLWRRSDDLRERCKEWVDQDPEFSKGEKSQPYVRLMLVADRWQERNICIDSDEQIRAILGRSESIVSSIPFDTVYSSAGGFIGRQLLRNDPHNLTLTWHLRRNLRSDVIIPLQFYECNSLEELRVELEGYNNVERFINILNKYNVSTIRVVDLNFLFNLLVGVVEIQRQLCALGNWSEAYYFKIKVLNAWRTIPFVDVKTILDDMEKNGLPMCLDSTMMLPFGKDPESFIEIKPYDKIEDEVTKLLIQSTVMFSPLASIFGIPHWISDNEESMGISYDQALQQAGNRANDVQHKRNERKLRTRKL